MDPSRSILITGASGGLGRCLALESAAPGVTLLLTGRDNARLNATADACARRGATVCTSRMDITDTAAVAAWIQEMNDASPIDLAIANAGISGGPGLLENKIAENTAQIFAVNVGGVLNTLLPVIPLMRRRRRGQIAIMSSLAGFRGLPSAPAYSASKAAVRAYGEGLRGALKRDGVGVTVICPGFVRTPMTEVNHFPMPLLMTPEKAAAIILRRLARNPARIAFPFPLYAAVWLAGCLPPGLTDPLFARLPEKP